MTQSVNQASPQKIPADTAANTSHRDESAGWILPLPGKPPIWQPMGIGDRDYMKKREDGSALQRLRYELSSTVGGMPRWAILAVLVCFGLVIWIFAS